MDLKMNWDQLCTSIIAFVGVLLTIVIIILMNGNVEGKTITVDDDGSADHTTITDAVAAANTDDRIEIAEGEYIESVTVNKRLVIEGEGRGNTKVHGDPAIEVTANGVTISGLWLSCERDDVSLIVSSNNCRIEDCMVGGVDSLRCILLVNAMNSIITNCDISREKDGGYGIGIEDSTNITITDCEIYQGIIIEGSDEITISGNGWPSTDQKSIKILDSNRNTINGVQANVLQLEHAMNNSIENCVFTKNLVDYGMRKYGFTMKDSGYNVVNDVKISDNPSGGMRLEGGCRWNVFTKLMITNNTGTGIVLEGENNTLHDVRINESGSKNSGIYLEGTGHTLTSVSLDRRGIKMDDVRGDYLNVIHSIDETNTVNGSPIYFLVDEADRVVPKNAGQIILVRCENITATGQHISNVTYGVQAYRSTSIVLSEQTHTEFFLGIRMLFCENVTIEANTLESNGINSWGIRIDDSTGCNVKNNEILSEYGVEVDSSLRIDISANVLNGTYAIDVDESNNCTITDNFCFEVLGEGEIYSRGINVYRSEDVIVSKNTCAEFSMGMIVSRSERVLAATNSILLSDDQGLTVTHSENIRISANSVTAGGDLGFYFSDISDVTCMANVISGNPVGMLITDSLKDIVMIRNSIEDSSECGLNTTSEDDVDIDARGNWWGHSSGPYHKEENSGGTGVEIFGDVLFDPWLGSPPSYQVPEVRLLYSIPPTPLLPASIVNISSETNSSEAIVQYVWISSIDGVLSDGMDTFMNITLWEEGIHMIILRVMDEAGIWSEDAVVQIEVKAEEPENLKPTVVIISPSDGERVTGTITISGTASDPDGEIEFVEIIYGDGGWLRLDEPGNFSSWSNIFETHKVSNGTYQIRVRSYDGELYSDIFWINVTVANEDTEDPGNGNQKETSKSDEGFIPGFETIAIIGSIAFVIIVTMKKRKMED